MKPLIPSHKENKRYLLIHGKNLKENIEKAIIEFAGGQGMSKCGLVFISSDYARDSAIIAVNREAVDLVRASIVVFPERMEILKVSGTLKGLGKK
jgi:RNase P/RNase MRP subunit POP5